MIGEGDLSDYLRDYAMATSPATTFKASFLPYLFIAPQLLITFIFFLWPAAQALWSSLQTSDPFGFSSQFSGWLNFQNLFTDSYYLESFKTTFIFSGLVAGGGLTIALVLAALVNHVIRGKKCYQTLFLLPYAVAPAIAGVMWLLLFSPGPGIVSHWLVLHGYHWNSAQNSHQALFLVVVASVCSKLVITSFFSTLHCNLFHVL